MQDSLNWMELKSKNNKERKRDIIRRANYYLYTLLFPYTLSSSALRVKYQALAEGHISTRKPDTPLELDIWTVNQMFPKTVDNHIIPGASMKYRVLYWRKPGQLETVYTDTLNKFYESELCTRLKKLVRPVFINKNISKIFAFGLCN
jgi:hypothetical protein